jgi:hypothetical protein
LCVLILQGRITSMKNVAIAQVGLVLVAVALVVCAAQQRPLAGDPAASFFGGLQRHAKAARTIRGFKNMALSTARGFGKRADRPPLAPASQSAASDFEQFDIQIPPQG